MSLKKALLAATVLALPVTAAQAQPVTGLYVGAGVGLNFRHDSDSRGVELISKQPGVVGLGAIGWGFGNGLRTEVEGNYRENEIDKLTIEGLPPVRGRSGYVRTYGAMVNVLYDLNLDSFFGLPLAPYVGVGAGYVWHEIKNARFTRGATSFRIDDQDDGRFAYQAIAGLAFKLFDVPGLAFTAEYRFLGTLLPKIGIDRVGGPPRPDVPAGFRPDNYNHSALLGVRYNFGAPRPVAPAVAETPVAPRPPEVARTYLVFFDWDRADLTDRARQIIAEAANASRTARATRIEVAGHADRSGTPQYNQRLSQRRADVVASELVRNGVNRGEIGVTAYG
ncbi:MAG: OmpA family protein, partial [Acetobacteraceae bacterium]|nr:OmpA family protein [Acetobacteraceae bacterium]